MRFQLVAVVSVLCGVASACGGSGTTPTSPSQPSSELSVGGTWSGSVTDSIGGSGTLRQVISQSGSALTGTWTGTYASGTSSGTTAGTVSGSNVSMTLTGTLLQWNVTAVVNGNTMNGSFTPRTAGASTGTFSLTKQ
jgi:hypothetical protein